MPIITITTDSGNGSIYLAQLKGLILSKIKEANLVEINTQIEPYNLKTAAFILKNAYKSFPPGTIHLIDIDSSIRLHKRYLVLDFDGHYFLSADNGFFSLLTEGKTTGCYQVKSLEPVKFRFEAFALVCKWLLEGLTKHPEFEIIEGIKGFTPMKLVTTENKITGNIVYVDHYGNCISNISSHAIAEIGKGRPFGIQFPRFDEIDIISEYYSDVSTGDVLCRINEIGLLEIAMNKGNASLLLGLKVGILISIEFKND